jgi:hypothetical protein
MGERGKKCMLAPHFAVLLKEIRITSRIQVPLLFGEDVPYLLRIWVPPGRLCK